MNAPLLNGGLWSRRNGSRSETLRSLHASRYRWGTSTGELTKPAAINRSDETVNGDRQGHFSLQTQTRLHNFLWSSISRKPAPIQTRSAHPYSNMAASTPNAPSTSPISEPVVGTSVKSRTVSTGSATRIAPTDIATMIQIFFRYM